MAIPTDTILLDQGKVKVPKTPEYSPVINLPGIEQTDQTEVQQQFVTPESTVAHQLSTLLQTDSPYLTAARNKAKEQANQLGLLSSTMAGGAAERAAIESALPIAQQDAVTFGDVGKQEQSILGQQRIARQGALNQSVLDTQKASQQADLEAMAQQYQLAGKQLEIQGDLEIQDRELYGSIINNIIEDYQDRHIQAQTANLSLTGKTNLSNALDLILEEQVKFVNKIFGEKVRWAPITYGGYDKPSDDPNYAPPKVPSAPPIQNPLGKDDSADVQF